jgi:predicted nuclease of predicted toxin-antitoxin system
LPTKTKRRNREDALWKEGWFPVSEDLWREPGQRLKKLKMIADANFPIQLVEIMRGRGIEVRTAQELGLGKRADDELLREVSGRNYVLITMDRDFWSDAKFPVHQRGVIVFIDAKDISIARTDGFELLILFLMSFGGAWTRGKIRASSHRMFLKLSVDGKKVVFEIKPFRPLIYAREVSESGI